MNIKELRKRCQLKKDPDPFKYISIYLTLLFLKAGISANTVIALEVMVALVGASILILFTGIYWIIGGCLLYFAAILDKVDGEVSRYHKTDSVIGAYWDGLTDTFRLALTLLSVSLGIYFHSNNFVPLLFSSGALMALFLYNFAEKAVYMLSYKNKRTPEMDAYDDVDLRRNIKGIRKIAVFSAQAFTRYTSLLLSVVLDVVFSSFLFTTLWILGYSLLFIGGGVVRIYECGNKVTNFYSHEHPQN